MTTKRRAILIAAALPVLLVLLTVVLAPFRWGMYLDLIREVAPITFYGSVVDAQGLPVAGASVTYQIDKPNYAFILTGDHLKRQPRYSVTTDAEGRFAVTGERGSCLMVTDVTKPGYKFVPRIIGGGNWDTAFYFAGGGVGRDGPHKADPQRPVTFDMRKMD